MLNLSMHTFYVRAETSLKYIYGCLLIMLLKCIYLYVEMNMRG